MTITFRNEFHARAVNCYAPHAPLSMPYTLSRSQYRRVKRELCGTRDCRCQTITSAHCHNIRLAVEPTADGASITVRLANSTPNTS